MHLIRPLIFSVLLLSVLLPQVIAADEPQEDDRLAWFRDARLGIFIHWGIYAVEGIDESWSFFNGYVSYDDYMAPRLTNTIRRIGRS